MNQARYHIIENHEEKKQSLLPCELDSSGSEVPVLSVVPPFPVQLRSVATQPLCCSLWKEATFIVYRLSVTIRNNVHTQLVSSFAHAIFFSLFLSNSPSFVHLCTCSLQPALLWFSFPLFCSDSDNF